MSPAPEHRDGRTTPTPSRAEATRARILDAATELFAETGYAGSSTRSLAAAAGVNIGSLAYHFGGKEGLYEAVLHRVYEQMVGFEFPQQPGESSAESLGEAVRSLYRFARARRSEVRLLLRHVVGHGSLPEAVRRRWNPVLLEQATGLIAALGLPTDRDIRLDLLTLNHLLTRYAITENDNLIGFSDEDDHEQAVADHLARVACRLLLDDEI